MIATRTTASTMLLVGAVGLIAMCALQTLMFLRLRRLDLPLGYIVAWGMTATVASLGIAAWWIALRYAG